MISTSELGKWQKAIQSIEAEQKKLSIEEWSAFETLRDNFRNGNFVSNECINSIHVIKNALSSHSSHRVLQKVYLPNFIKLCETYFKEESYRKTHITEPTPPAFPIIPPVMQGNDVNKNTAKSNNSLIPLIVVIAFLIGSWQVYKNWDTVRNWEPVSKLLGKTEVPNIPIDTVHVSNQKGDSTTMVYTVTTVPNVHLNNAADYVTNPDGIISQAAKDKLNAMIVSVESATTDEIAVVLLSSIGKDDIDDFATRLFNYWGIGKANINNGLLFLLVNDQKEMVFRTGSGLESVLPDTILYRVIQNDISPLLRNGDFDGGIIAGVAKVCDYLKNPETVQKIMQSDKESQPITQTPKLIAKNYSFGIYKGTAINGYPEGNGKMKYSRQVQIAKHDTKSPPHFAENGDHFVGSWGNGDIISGTLYDRNGNVKEKIVAPKRFNLHDISND